MSASSGLGTSLPPLLAGSYEATFSVAVRTQSSAPDNAVCAVVEFVTRLAAVAQRLVGLLLSVLEVGPEGGQCVARQVVRLLQLPQLLGCVRELFREHIGRLAGPGEDLVLLGDPLEVPQCLTDVVGEVVQDTGQLADPLRIARSRIPLQVEYVPVGRSDRHACTPVTLATRLSESAFEPTRGCSRGSADSTGLSAVGGCAREPERCDEVGEGGGAAFPRSPRPSPSGRAASRSGRRLHRRDGHLRQAGRPPGQRLPGGRPRRQRVAPPSPANRSPPPPTTWSTSSTTRATRTTSSSTSPAPPVVANG
ncbi:hypothetical protein SHIRM173S_07737 [Streptomyces hirsutus]